MRPVVVAAVAGSALAVTAALAGCGGGALARATAARAMSSARSPAATPGTGPAPSAIDWSGDKTRVLLEQPGTSLLTMHELTIATGQVTTFTLPSAVTAVLGYTRPDGDNILVAQNGIARYSLTGVFQASLSQAGPNESVVSSLNGLTEIVGGGAGVELVSNASGVVRSLPVPGTDSNEGGCQPVRWWNASDVLVFCMPSPGPSMFSAARLWLVPVSGAPPTGVTPQRSLLWLNPATNGAQRVLTALPNSTGVVSAIAFDGNGERPS
jgi:hypothetical protein